MMDDSVVVKSMLQRQRRPIAEKRRMVEQAMQPGASVARVAQQHGVNANLLFHRRNLYRRGLLTEPSTSSLELLPVKVADGATSVMSAGASGTIEVTVARAQIRIAGRPDREALGVVLEYVLR
jgi:transposase